MYIAAKGRDAHGANLSICHLSSAGDLVDDAERVYLRESEGRRQKTSARAKGGCCSSTRARTHLNRS